MTTEMALLTLYAETPVHAGAGESSDLADLPMQREKPSDLPMIQSSAIKNMLRRLACGRGWDKDLVKAIFGAEGDQSPGGALFCTDARLLLFPVASLTGVFAYTTCPFVLYRLQRELKWVEATAASAKIANVDVDQGSAHFAANSPVLLGSQGAAATRIFLHDTPFTRQTTPALKLTALCQMLGQALFGAPPAGNPPPADPEAYWRTRLNDSLV
ncbi:MAG: type III-B CRISPR module RAMP protein Cmr4, partial [Chloroflexota bacterium]